MDFAMFLKTPLVKNRLKNRRATEILQQSDP